jgi:hypothetical protein
MCITRSTPAQPFASPWATTLSTQAHWKGSSQAHTQITKPTRHKPLPAQALLVMCPCESPAPLLHDHLPAPGQPPCQLRHTGKATFRPLHKQETNTAQTFASSSIAGDVSMCITRSTPARPFASPWATTSPAPPRTTAVGNLLRHFSRRFSYIST